MRTACRTVRAARPIAGPLALWNRDSGDALQLRGSCSSPSSKGLHRLPYQAAVLTVHESHPLLSRKAQL